MAKRSKKDVRELAESSRLAGDLPVFGQDAAIELLQQAIKLDRMPSSWIFHGPDGVGKRTTALRLARLLLEPTLPSGAIERFEPPHDTHASGLIDAGTHPDLVVLRKEMASQSQISDLRDKKQMEIPTDLLREHVIGGLVKRENRVFEPAVFHSPYTANRRVFLIEEAELLNQTGQNALLKTLEEPPPTTVLILLTSNADRLLPTIRSRCQQLSFRRLDDAAMQSWLKVAAPQVDDQELQWAVRFSEGSPGLTSFALQHGLKQWDAAISPALEQMLQGRYPETFGDELAGLIEDFVKAQGKGNRQLSKTRANRDGLSMVLSVIAGRLRESMQSAVEDGDVDLAERLARTVDDLVDAERRGDRALNLKHLLGGLVASMAESLAGGPRAVL